MIKEIKIENFKSIASLNLELGRLNVFIGANGSGKSNILEGITFGGAAMDNKLGKEFFRNRGIRYTEPKRFFSGFEKNSSQKSINIGFKHLNGFEEYLRIRYTNKWKIGFGKDDIEALAHEINQGNPDYREGGIVYEMFKDGGGFKMDNERLEEFLTYVMNFLIYAPENASLRNFDDEGAIEPLGVKGEGLFSHIAKIFKNKPDLFQKINEHLQLLDWFDGFEIPNDLMFTEKRIKIKDRYLEDGLQYFDQRSANEGFLYLLFYLTLFISDETPKFFAIDNIDNAMNPKMGSELIHILSKLSKEHNKQVILTTHNPSILDGLDLSNDNQRLFVVSRNKSGHTKVLRVPHIETDLRLSESFIRGYIGGLPKNF